MTAVLAPAARRAGPWQAVLPALTLALACALLLYRDTAVSMAALWARSDTYMHAFLVPPIVAWLVWRDRRRIAAAAPRPAPWVLLPLLAAAAAWMLGALADANALMHFGFVALLVLSTTTLVGLEAARAMAFPLLFAFFAVPAGDFMIPRLMEGTADFTVAALRISGVPVYREGLTFMIPSGSWSVVEACSGVRYLIASAMVGVLFAYVNFRSTRRRLAFVAMALAVPVLANWVRAYLIVMLGHLSRNTLATGVDHLIYGWLFFGTVMLLLYMIGARWANAAAPASRPMPRLRGAAPPRAAAVWTTAALVLLVLALPALGRMWLEQPDGRAATPAIDLPAPPGWAAHPAAVDFRPAWRGASAEVHRAYERSGQRVEVHLLLYRHQDEGRKLTASGNALVGSDDTRWSAIATRNATVIGVPVAQTLLRTRSAVTPPQERRVWHSYLVDGRRTDSAGRARLHIALQRLQGRGDDAAVLVMSGDDDGTLRAFLQDALPVIERSLLAAREAR